MIALAPINIIVVTRKKVTMHKENEVCRNGFRYIRRETFGFRICRIVFISRRRRSEDLLPFSSQRVVRATFFPGGSYVKHADNLPSSAEGGQGDVLPEGKIRQTAAAYSKPSGRRVKASL